MFAFNKLNKLMIYDIDKLNNLSDIGLESIVESYDHSMLTSKHPEKYAHHGSYVDIARDILEERKSS